jgi:hypothetical protein
MGAPAFTTPQSFVNGGVVGRAQLGVLLDNDRYFNGLCDRWRTVVAGGQRTNTITQELWDGYHLLRSDAKTLYYCIEAGTNAVVDLYYDYGGANQTLIATADNANPVRSGSYDLSSFDPGLYRVYARNRGTSGTTSTCWPPYTVYTGALSYTTPPTITDGSVASYVDFNKFVANDLFFNANRPPQPAFVAGTRKFIGTETSLIIWHGWIKHHNPVVRYHIKLNPYDAPGNSNNNQMRIIYGYGSALAENVIQTAVVGEHEGSHTLVNAFVDGNWYHVAVEISRDDGNGYIQTSSVYYLMTEPAAASATFTNMGDLTVGQFVYGSTAGQNTRLQLLSDNDNDIDDRLLRMDFAVREAEYVDLGDSGGTWHYRLKRRYDTLYYRGTNVTLQFGDDESVALTDVSAGYGTYNLQQASGLVYGMIYQVVGSLQFAMEA